MADIDPDELLKWHNKGEQDASDGRTEMLGGPAQDFFESDEHYATCLAAYRAGRENFYSQQ